MLAEEEILKKLWTYVKRVSSVQGHIQPPLNKICCRKCYVSGRCISNNLLKIGMSYPAQLWERKEPIVHSYTVTIDLPAIELFSAA